MSRVIDLTTHGRGTGSSGPLEHPAGVIVPFEGPSDSALIIPEVRSEIRSGAYDADMIALLDAAVRPGDRVLVIGAGLGILTTLIAKREGVERVIAVEANTALVPYLERTHVLNGVETVECVNAVLAEGKTGRVPFFARRDIRASSLLPHDRSWQQVMMVPFMDLNLILAEERISLVVSELPVASAELLARAELNGVQRILLNTADDSAAAWADDGVCALLVARGYVPEASGTAVLFRRAETLTGDEAPSAAAAAARDDEATDEADEEDDHDGEDDEEKANGDEPEAQGAARPANRAAPVAEPATEPAADSAGKPPGEVPGEPVARAASGPAAAPPPDTGARAERSHPEPEPAEAAPAERRGATDGGRGRLLWGLLALALVLALPLMLIGHFAAERGGARSAAVESVRAAWGGPQTLTGPFLMVPVRAADGSAAAPLVVLPETLEAVTALETETRREGPFDVMVYRGESEFRLTFGPDPAAAAAPGETVLWEETALALGVSDPRALGQARLLGGPESVAFEPGSGVAGLPGIRARIGDPRGRGGEWAFALELNGADAIRLTPAGGLTVWRLQADWPHPVFEGDFAPTLHGIGAGGFVAEWRVPEVAHALPRALRDTERLGTLGMDAFGARLVQPVDLYRTAERAAKFGLLIIVLTFGTLFLIERSAKRTARVAHYALIGAAQCAFFLLLLALAERIGFGPGYAVAAVTTVGLLTMYAWLGLALGPRAGWVTLALALLYAVMYPVLLAEEHALLMSAVLAFLVIAALMWGTSVGRRTDGEAEPR